MTGLIDTHCHLTDEQFDHDREQVLARARVAGVDHVIVVGDAVDSSAAALRLAHERPAILSTTAGIHPHNASVCPQGMPPLSTHPQFVPC